MAFFVNDTSNALGNTFTLVFDDVSLLKGSAEFSYHMNEKFSILIRGNFYKYNMDTEAKPWHKPQFDLLLSGSYSIQKKILIRADIFTNGKRYAKTFDKGIEQAKQLDGFVDLNLGIEYRYTKILSAFVNFNNIISNRYFIWNNYPSQKFNFMAGLSYSF